MTQKNFKVKTDFLKEVLEENFHKRGWEQTDHQSEWNLYWASLPSALKLFQMKSSEFRLKDGQFLNHYPNSNELCRKDLMAKNIKRFKREMEKENSLLLADDQIDCEFLNIVPTTFSLPLEYNIFIEEFHREQCTWIVKPVNMSQGQGIFLLSNIRQLQKMQPNNLKKPNLALKPQQKYVIQKYLSDPLLIGGKKFDLRIYALVTCFRPLKIWLFIYYMINSYKEGFARFCTEKYTTDIAEIENQFVHLTNVAIQKYSDKYNNVHGGKWNMQTLKFYIQQLFGQDVVDKCWEDMQYIIMISLKASQSQMMNNNHCFELFGYDIMIDAQCKPWLIEVNNQPSLSTTSDSDKQLKLNVINDVLDIVINKEKTQQKIILQEISKLLYQLILAIFMFHLMFFNYLKCIILLFEIERLLKSKNNSVGGFQLIFDDTTEESKTFILNKRTNKKIKEGWQF